MHVLFDNDWLAAIRVDFCLTSATIRQTDQFCQSKRLLEFLKDHSGLLGVPKGVPKEFLRGSSGVTNRGLGGLET